MFLFYFYCGLITVDLLQFVVTLKFNNIINPVMKNTVSQQRYDLRCFSVEVKGLLSDYYPRYGVAPATTADHVAPPLLSWASRLWIPEYEIKYHMHHIPFSDLILFQESLKYILGKNTDAYTVNSISATLMCWLNLKADCKGYKISCVVPVVGNKLFFMEQCNDTGTIVLKSTPLCNSEETQDLWVVFVCTLCKVQLMHRQVFVVTGTCSNTSSDVHANARHRLHVMHKGCGEASIISESTGAHTRQADPGRAVFKPYILPNCKHPSSPRKHNVCLFQ